MGKIVYLSLGSNLGDRIETIQQALKQIEQFVGPIENVSRFYETEPWGFESDQKFVNICISLNTEIPPNDLLKSLQNIEKELGRTKSSNKGYASRTIDIDILTIGMDIIQSQNLIVPHPAMENRKFVLFPLQEIAPNFIHPKTAKTIKQLIALCADETSVFTDENK
jgi:2-amino-4-hydroxy-6-hydroxymethyldihydropteridine diphosphokinase